MTVHQAYETDLVLANIRDQLRPLTKWLNGRKLNKQLSRDLGRRFPMSDPNIVKLLNSLREGFGAGRLGKRVDPKTVYQHIADAAAEHSQYSIDAVVLTNVKGGRHRHPRGEIDLVIPLQDEARFDGKGEGWLVYPPNSRHSPTVTGGSAIVLFLLPNGEMAFD